jgi:DNA-binding response OmpR family regulator
MPRRARQKLNPPSHMSKKIAIAEDEAELSSLIEYNLNRGGFLTRIFPGGEDALEQLRTGGPI